MIACKSTSQVRRTFRKASRGPCRVEALEGRTLMSGTWSTVDTVPAYLVKSMAADASGDVYAVGYGSAGNWILREKPAGSPDVMGSWNTVATTVSGTPLGIAVGPNGDVMVAGDTNNGATWAVWDLPKGSSSFVQVDSVSNPMLPCQAHGLTFDSGGNVYVVGDLVVTNNRTSSISWSVRKGTYNPSTGLWAFSTLDQVAGANATGVGIVRSTVNGVPSTGIYVVGNQNGAWVARESKNGGSTWAQVDNFHYDSTAGATSWARNVSGDSAGNVYVVGNALKAVVTGHDKHGNPIYSFVSHWIVRKSANGGGSWSPNDDYQYPAAAPQAALAMAVGSDLAGNMYVAGYAYDNTGLPHAIIRTNTGGSWATGDDYTSTVSGSGAWYYGFAVDPSGNLYAGGKDLGSGAWLIRSLPAAPANVTATADATFPSSQIDLSWANAAGSDETGFAIYRSTDGINFTAIATLGASATAYSDSGLSAGTTYYYYVVALLNATGASAPSNAASATTSA